MQQRDTHHRYNAFECARPFPSHDSTCSLCSVVPNVFVRPPNKTKEADAAKALLSVPGGDHLTLLNVYNEYQTSKSHESLLARTCSKGSIQTEATNAGLVKTTLTSVYCSRPRRCATF